MDAPDFQHRACPACGSHKSQDEVRSLRRAETLGFDTLRPFWTGLLKEKPFFTYHRCADCGLLFNPVYFHDHQLATLYAEMAPNMELVSNDAIVATQRGYFKRAAEAARLDGGYLEIGPDAGHIVAEAARTGTFDHFWLFEPNRAVHGQLREAARGRPVTLSSGMDDLSSVPDGSIGLAVMIHVLDHMLEPLAMLEQVRKKLRPGGAALIVTHNERSLLRWITGVRWPPFCLQHPELYNPRTMRRLLRRAGFHDIAVERSLNYFPIDFLARAAAWTIGVRLRRIPLPRKTIGLRLGNMLTLARAPHHAAAAHPRELEAA